MIRALSTFGVVLFVAMARGEEREASITVTGGKEDAKNLLVTVAIPDKIGGEFKDVAVKTSDGSEIVAQLADPRLLAPVSPQSEVTLLIPALKAGENLSLKLRFLATKKPAGFQWQEVDGLEELRFEKRPVLRYFHKPFDAKLSEKGKEIANPTIKPYHHLFSPDGKTMVTNSNRGQYPHHRGIFFGFNNISYDGKKADVWHCRNGEHTEHEKILDWATGPLFGRHTLQIGWHGQDGKLFANEKRELTAYNLPGGTLIEFESILSTPLEKVRLDGDPQHAGFHFRADSAMEKDIKSTYFLRPDGKGDLGKEKNWEPKGKSGPVNLAWDTMSFVLAGNRYTVVHLDHPDNPKEARQSERCYGRIGTYFEYDLTKAKPLKVRYRLWFQDGEVTAEQCANLSRAFVEPVIGQIDAK